MNIIKKIKQIQNEEINKTIKKRIGEFEEIGKNNEKIFLELCFCILTANSNAENCIRVQRITGKKFKTLNKEKLIAHLKETGCRFHTKRAGYIYEAREKEKELFEKIENLEEKELRNWIANNIKGLGMKESSHFLRNIGYKNIAIIDFHILDLLEKENLLIKPKKLDKKTYLEIEKILEDISNKVNLSLAELDLYLWYLETGKILK